MFSWLRRLTSGTPRAAAPAVRARYDNSLTTPENQRQWWGADWLSAKSANNYQVRRQLRVRSRYEVSNNPYLFGICNNNADDLVSTGPTLQLTTPDAGYNRAVERAWREWAAEVELAEKLRTCKLAKSVDGEGFLVLKTVRDLEHPVKLYPCDVEADQVTTPAPNNLIELWVDGLDLHPVTGRPVAYHVLKNHPGDYFFPTMNPLAVERLPARHVVHWFHKFRPGMVRGVPVFTPSLDLFVELRAYRRAVLGAAELAADFAAVLEQDRETGAYAPDEDTDAEIEAFKRVPIDRKMMTTLPPGAKMAQFRPEQPQTTYEMFQEKCLGEACRPLSYPLNLALGTSQKFNFSSAKLDHINYRSSLDVERRQCEGVVLAPLFAAWYEEAVLAGAVPMYDGTTLPPHEWHWPGYEPLDPVADAQADHERLSNGTLTWREFWARRGHDWRDVLLQQAAEQAEIARLGLEFGEPATKSITEDGDPPDGGENPRAAKAARPQRIRAKEWEEDKHPRDDDGKFGPGGGGGGKKGEESKDSKDSVSKKTADYGHGEGRDATGAKEDAKPGQRYRVVDRTTTYEGVKKDRAKDLTPAEAKDAVRWHDGMTQVGKNEPNTKVPDGSRPKLDDSERGALQKYSYLNDRVLNSKLRGNEQAVEKSPYNDAFYDQMHKSMQSAFDKAEVLKTPVTVVRGMRLDDATLEKFVGKAQDAVKSGGAISFEGYTSTAAPGGLAYKLGLDSGIPKPFRGNVSLKINAVHGLDMGPHSQLPGEKEFLLNHASEFKVRSVTKKKDGWHVELDQLPPKKKAAKAGRAPAILATADDEGLTRGDREVLDYYEDHPQRWNRWVEHDADFIRWPETDEADEAEAGAGVTRA